MAERTVFDLAKRDHQRHLGLIDDVRAEQSAAGRARTAARLAADLRRHAQAEHAGLLAALLVEPSVRPLARRAVADHQRLHRLMSDLTCGAGDELEMGVALSIYRAAFLEYVRFEEEELYPAATLALGTERCVRLADAYRSAVQGDHMLAR